jgi:DNA-entry nuclease
VHNKNRKLNILLSLFLLITLLCTSLSGCNISVNTPPSSISSEQESETEKDSASDTQTDTSSETETDTPFETESETEINTEDSTESQGNSSSSNNNGDTNTESSNSGSTNSNNNSSGNNTSSGNNSGNNNSGSTPNYDVPVISGIPAYSGTMYITLNSNQPNFSADEITAKSFENYSPLDALGRCGVAFASLGKDLMPTDERGSISSVRPTGWHSTNYASVPGGSLYNRSHLIAWSLAGENANDRNLITGTRDLNQTWMTKFEDMVYDYIKETGNHVMYRVTPHFAGNNLIASGVQMEAWSVEDDGEDICFNVFIYNVQEGIAIDYATGESYEINPPADSETTTPDVPAGGYAVNGNNGKIHMVGECTATQEGHKSQMKNPIYFDTYEEALDYVQREHPDQDNPKCGNCW